MRKPQRRIASWCRLGALLIISFVAMLGWAPIALAHTAFEASDPADGASIDRPVDVITITFTGASEAAGEGFQVLTPNGEILEPTVSVSDDRRTFTLRLDTPLVDGTVGVRWSVRAGDAHPIEGAFSFTTTAQETPLPTPTPPAATVTPEVPAAAAGASGEDVDSGAAAPTAPDTPQTPPVQEEPTAPGREQIGEERQEVAEEAEEVALAAPVPVDLETFLQGDSDDGLSAADGVGYVGRALTFMTAMFAVGASALSLVVVRELLSELRHSRWIAIAAAGVAAGALLEAGSFMLDGSSGLLKGQIGIAVGFRFMGAIAIAAGCLRRRPVAQLLGAGFVLVSFTFDGHTASEGNRLITGVADVIHSGAAAIWVGGVAVLLMMRYANSSTMRDRVPLFAARFSTIATVAIALVGLAGIGLTVTIIDSASDIWTTSWGRSLIAKTLVVAGALGLGAYNHFRLVPAVEHGQPGAVARLGRVLRVELALLLAAGALTALLVAGAT